MKKALPLLLIFLIGINQTLFAEEAASKEKGKVATPAPKTEPKKPSKKDEEKREALRKLIQEKKKELNGTSWEVEIKSQTGKGVLIGKDTLTFQDEQFHSGKASKNGYSTTNYTLTAQEDGPTIWETMQTSSEGEVTFWRGEWKESGMSGVISRQLKSGNEDYYFTSSSKKEIPETSEKATEEVVAAKETIESAPVLGTDAKLPAQTEASKPAPKKGWFS